MSKKGEETTFTSRKGTGGRRKKAWQFGGLGICREAKDRETGGVPN